MLSADLNLIFDRCCTCFPVSGAYFCINMILITLSTFLAVIVITTHIRGDKKNKVPDWLRQVTDTSDNPCMYLHDDKPQHGTMQKG